MVGGPWNTNLFYWSTPMEEKKEIIPNFAVCLALLIRNFTLQSILQKRP
jgi:hypothetical protein